MFKSTPNVCSPDESSPQICLARRSSLADINSKYMSLLWQVLVAWVLPALLPTSPTPSAQTLHYSYILPLLLLLLHLLQLLHLL